MATSYSISSGTPKDKARLLLGDTGVDGGVFLLHDEEILGFISSLPFNQGVALLADGLAARFAQYPDEVETSGGSKTKWSERVKTWRELSASLKKGPNPLASAPKRTTARLGNLTNPANTATPGYRGVR